MARIKLSGIQVPTVAKLNIDGEFTLGAAAGTSGHMLISQGAGNTPIWSNTLTSPTITTSLLTGSTSFNLLTTTATTINFGSAATTMNIATNNIAKTINIGTGGSGGNQVDVNIGTSASATTSNINLYGQTILGKPTTSSTTVSGFGTGLTTQGTVNTGTTGNATGSNLQIYSGGASLTNASNITGTATSGNLILDVGSVSTASIDAISAYGNVQIAPSSASAVTVGRSGITTTVNGTLSSATARLNDVLLTSISTIGGGGGEGGQINFARVTDGAQYWYIDSFGTTATPDLRFIENATERLRLASGGAIYVGGSAGTSGQVLTSAGTASAPTWSNVSYAGGTLTSSLTLRAGTATASTAPLYFQSGTNLTTAAAGAVEYDGNVFYQTANATPGRALNTQNYIYASSATWTPDFSLNSSAKSILGAATTGITLPAGTTYQYECTFALRGTFITGSQFPIIDITSSTVSGTPTVAHDTYFETGNNTTNFTTLTTLQTIKTTASVSLTTLSAGSRYYFVRMKGLIRVTGSGTAKIYPSIAMSTTSADNTWTVQTGAIFSLTPIGNGTVTTVGTWA